MAKCSTSETLTSPNVLQDKTGSKVWSAPCYYLSETRPSQGEAHSSNRERWHPLSYLSICTQPPCYYLSETRPSQGEAHSSSNSERHLPLTLLVLLMQMCPIFSRVSTFMFRCAKWCPLYRVQISMPSKKKKNYTTGCGILMRSRIWWSHDLPFFPHWEKCEILGKTIDLHDYLFPQYW